MKKKVKETGISEKNMNEFSSENQEWIRRQLEKEGYTVKQYLTDCEHKHCEGCEEIDTDQGQCECFAHHEHFDECCQSVFHVYFPEKDEDDDE